MKRLLILFPVLFWFDAQTQQQGRPLDSLLQALPKLKDDSNKVVLLAQLVKAELMINPKEGIPYAQQMLQLAEKINWKKGIANAHNSLGLLIGDTGNNTLARTHFEQSYTLNKELGSTFNIINNLNNIGRSYQRESDFSKASGYYFKALLVAEEIKSSEQVALVATNITASFFAQRNYSKATEYANLALKNGELAKVPNHIGKALMQLGNIKAATNDTPGASRYFEKALKVYQEMNNKPAMAQVLSNMAGMAYPDYKKALAIMLQALAIYDEIAPSSIGAIANLNNAGQACYDQAMHSKQPGKSIWLQKSEVFLKRAIALCEQTHNAEYSANASLLLADAESESGDYKSALENYKKANSINDSLFSQDKKNEIAGLEGKHDMAIKDDEIAINKLMLANQRKTQLGLIAGLALFGIIGGLLYWQSRNRKRTNTTLMVLNNQLDEANKVKARFFGILSHDLRSPIVNLVHFLHLQKNDPDLLSEEQQVSHRQQISDSAEDLLNTMESMLLWSKEQMENFRPNIKDIQVSDLFAYLQKFVGQTEKISMRFSHEPGLVVSTDENYLRTIMQNLTSNAIRALENTPGATIEWNAKKEGNKTILSITDNGPGIGEEQAKALFDDSIVNNEKNGFGLHLIRDLAKAIQYKITVQSGQGRGTTFTLSNVAA